MPLMLPALLAAATLASPAATLTPCHDGLLAGQALQPHVAVEDSALTVRASAPAGTDYDLAVFDRATGRLLGGSASFTSAERVTVLLERGQAVDVQACRRSGPAEPVAVDLASQPLTGAKPEPPQLVAVDADPARLEALGLDVTHAGEVVTYSAADRRKLRGLDVTVVEDDLPAALRRMLRADVRRGAQARALPSGRTTYRTPADYGTDLKAIADTNPARARLVTMPGTSLEGRPFEGVEIADGVGAEGDGRPILLISGLTHAREWPGGELAIEFATDLAASTDPRMVALREKVRVFVFPLANPDGFAVSRAGGPAGGDDTPQATTLPQALNDQGAYKRKNCRALTPELQALPCATRFPFGVDLNRAYSAYWGGEGSDDNPQSQGYRGPAPFTEPEALAVRGFGQANQVQVYITNHTFTDVGRILRQPGFDIAGDEVEPTVPDEPRIKALGDAMGESTGYVSELGYATLGNITGPADDFLYYAQGTYGYTPEMRGLNFHTGYADAVVGEYEGEGPQAGRGWREAYVVAGEFAASTADHVVLKGTAPADATLRLSKAFALPQSLDGDGDGQRDTTPEIIDASLAVPAGGAYEWHVNPSKRPYGPADEAFTLTCERGGAVRATRTFTAARGEAKTFDFADCGTTAIATPTATVTATATPTYADPLRVSLRRSAISARRANRRRFTKVRVVLGGTGRLTGVKLRVARKGRTVLRRSFATIDRTRWVRLRRVKRLRRGVHRVVLTAGGGIRATKRVRVRR